MNIFVLDKNPERSARYHSNKHVVKMILESAQMLSQAHHNHNSKYKDKVYRSSYKNHPCTLWACETSENYNWLYNLLKHLLEEYTYRYERTHATSKLMKYLKHNPNPKGKLTKFAMAMPDKYKTKDPIKSYRNYYINEKYYFAKWKNRKTPSWFKEKV